MESNTINASANPGLANELITKALAEVEEVETSTEVPVILPSDTLVDLPAGYITPDGGVAKTAEVRELTGKDEEAISRATTLGRMFNIILSRGVVSVGGVSVTEKMLDEMFAGDRDALLLGIYRATFGNPSEMKAYCGGCEDLKDVLVDLNTDIKVKPLIDPIAERAFTVEGANHEYTVILPTGVVQRELNNAMEKTIPELTSILLENTVTAIDGNPVYNKVQTQNIGIKDRRAISEAIAERAPGPKFEDITVTCPDCESEVVVPINLGALFQF
jgi:hypothetical protein